MQKISYVIPCYRSQHTVGGVVAEIAATMQTLPQYDYEVILVNDCSPDDTFGTIRSLVAADSHVVGVDLAKNFGQHAALMAGFHKCSGDIVVCLDDESYRGAVADGENGESMRSTPHLPATKVWSVLEGGGEDGEV